MNYALAPDYDKDVFDMRFVEGIKPNAKIIRSYHDYFGHNDVPWHKSVKRKVKKILRWAKVMK